MSTEVSWPPRSTTAALLSSPSGRKRYAKDPDSTLRSSPSKQTTTTPGLLERMRAARKGQDILDGAGGDEEEDEETLQLKLAAIEAKLRLKKLQKDKARLEAENVRSSEEQPNVEVLLSPVKRRQIQVEQKSPSRVLLGIDKGIRGADVSLRRAKTRSGTPLRDRLTPTRTREQSPVKASGRPSTLQRSAEITKEKSFSELMAHGREADKDHERRILAGKNSRTSGFKVDQTELSKYKKVAEDASKTRATSPRKTVVDTYSRDDILRAQREEVRQTLKETFTKPTAQPASETTAQETKSSQGDASLYEGYSQLHLTTRILPHSFLKRTLPSESHTIYRIPDLLREVTSPDYQIPEDVNDYVIVAVIASKSSPLDHKQPQSDDQTHGSQDWERKWDDGAQNQRKFIALTLTDLKWTVDLYLFGTAVPRYHRLMPGTVVAILNPSIMPPKKGKEDTGAFSLTLNDGDDTVLEIGTARDLWFCNATKKDGKKCGSWVDSSKSEICEWHLNMQIAKARAGRMGVNAGSNGFKGGTGVRNRANIFDSRLRGEEPRYGLKPLAYGQRYDRDQQTHYYVASSNVSEGITNPPTRQTGGTPLHFDENPFLPDGQLSRDRKAHLQKRRAAQAKERETARQLMEMNAGGAGTEYMRHAAKSKKQREEAASQIGGSEERQRAALATKMNILEGKRNENGKREADSVRLSPVKRTRFVDRYVREAEREQARIGESLGLDEDDLDIVED